MKIYKFNMNPMKILYIYLIKCIIIIGFCLPLIHPASAAHKHGVKGNKAQMNESKLEENTINANGAIPCSYCKYKVYIIAIAAMLTIALPGAAGWYLYYRMKKKNEISDEEKAIEESQPETFIARMSLWLSALRPLFDKLMKIIGELQLKTYMSKITIWLSTNCTLEMLSLLYAKLRKKKTIYDEEKAIEKSQPKAAKPKTTKRDKPGTGKKMAKADEKLKDETSVTGKKIVKKTKKKKKAPVTKSVGKAIEVPSIKQSTDKPVKSGQSPQILAIPEEKIVKKKKKKKAPVTKSVGKAIEAPSIKQSTDEPVKSVQSPQILAIPKEKIVKKKKKKTTPVTKSVGKAIEVPSIKQATDEPVKSAQSPQILAIPKGKKVEKTKKKAAPVTKSVGKATETPSMKQWKDEESPQILAIINGKLCYTSIANLCRDPPMFVPVCIFAAEQGPVEPVGILSTEQVPAEPASILPTEQEPAEPVSILLTEQEPAEQASILSTEQGPTEPVSILATEPESLAAVNVLSTEEIHVPAEKVVSVEHVESDMVSMQPVIPEFEQPFMESQKETPSTYKRITVLRWIEEITDDEASTD